ncbi:MAG: MerR family transcriptional regulator, partial [Polyangiaceae bacterium]
MSHRLPIVAPLPSLESSAVDVCATPVPKPARADEEQGLMQVGDLARESGKTVRAIHLYEELELLKPTARSKGRYRLYMKEALVRIRWIGKLQDMGFTLTDIQTVLHEWETSSSAPTAMVRMRE